MGRFAAADAVVQEEDGVSEGSQEEGGSHIPSFIFLSYISFV